MAFFFRFIKLALLRIFFTVFILFLTSPVQALFSVQSSGLSVPLRDIYAFNANMAIVVGDEGNILRTTDGGETWTPVASSGTTGNLFSVGFLDANYGWAVGTDASVYSIDGGLHWTQSNINTSYEFSTVKFAGKAGWLLAGTETGSVILSSTNNGTSWTNLSTVNGMYLLSSFLLDPNTGWVVGSNGSTGIIRKTIDAGTNWTQYASEKGDYLRAVHFSDANTGVVTGGTAVLNTINGGSSWNRQILSGSVNDVYMINSRAGWIVGDGGKIFSTADGGAVWTLETSPVNNALYAVTFADSTAGWIVGGGGAIIKILTSAGIKNPQKPENSHRFIFTVNQSRNVFATRLTSAESVEITNIKGGLILSEPVSGSGFHWNGKDLNGFRVSNGSYLVNLKKGKDVDSFKINIP